MKFLYSAAGLGIVVWLALLSDPLFNPSPCQVIATFYPPNSEFVEREFGSFQDFTRDHVRYLHRSSDGWFDIIVQLPGEPDATLHTMQIGRFGPHGERLTMDASLEAFRSLPEIECPADL